MPDRVISVPQATQIAQRIKNKFDNVNGRLQEVTEDVSDIQSNISNIISPLYEDKIATSNEASKIIKFSGTILDVKAGDDKYHVVRYNVTSGEKYYLSASANFGNALWCFYDLSNNVVEIGIKSPDTDEKTFTTVEGTAVTVPAGAVTLAVAYNINNVIGTCKYISAVRLKPKWSGKKWVVLGDSLTQVNKATTKHYFDYISDTSGINVYNMGAGGTGYARGYNNNNAFYQRISSVPTDSDVVTIFGSGNDMNIEAMSMFDGVSWSDALGTYTDTGTTTICGCINTTLDNYFTVMPTVPIGIIAPTPWHSYPTTKLTNNKFEDYTNALEQIAKYRGVPFLDLYHHSNLRPENEVNRNACFYSGASLDGNGDGVHPNELGHKIIAPKIYEFVKSLLLD